MAIEKKQILGEITGTLGNIVRRKKYGKTVVYLRPAKYRISKSNEAKAGRTSFALSVALARAVNSIPELKQIWKVAKLEGVVAYNRIIKYNKKFISKDNLTIQNIITPAGTFLLVNSIIVTKTELNLEILIMEDALKSLLQSPFNFYYALYLSNPVNANIKPFDVLCRSILIDKQPENDIYSINFNFDYAVQQIISQYKNIICYTAASKLSLVKKEIYWTNAYSRLFEL